MFVIFVHHVARAASVTPQMTSAQHATTVELEGVIIALVCAVIAGLYRLKRDGNDAASNLATIRTEQVDQGRRLERVEGWIDRH